MKKNVGTIDRAIRVILGLVIIGLGVAFQSWWGAIGAVPLLTALIGWCPPYAILGLSTCKAAEKKG
ncbi:DUF2892 domain-containing protein [bacterium]|nr:DUF2892 domain-containing protein [bacterium]